ncbi:MAG: hypothetical protein GY822_24730, partial [Deltaproteobacteria bacterium]|nr:hypothetical protein [Deltaproteobacteria bacterium]
MTHSAEHEHESGSSSSKDDLPLRLLLTSLFAGALLMRILSTSQPGSSSDALFASIFSVLALFLWRTGDDFSFTVEGLSTSRALGRVERLAMLWALLAAFSLSWSWHPAQSFRALSVVWSPVAVFLGLRALKHPEHLRVLYAVAIGGALQALNGLFQVFVQWPDALLRRHELSLPPSIVQRMETGRPIGMSLSPDLFGALCFAGGCASFALFIYARGERRRECTSPRPKKTFERF